MDPNSAGRQLARDAYRLRDAGWLVMHDAVPDDLIQTLAEAAQAAIDELLASIGGIDALAGEAVGPGRLGAYLSLAPPFAHPWHRGSANGSSRPRTMIAVGYSAPWVRYPPLHVPDAAWEALPPGDRPLLEESRRHGRPPLATTPVPEPVLQLEPHWASTSTPASPPAPIR